MEKKTKTTLLLDSEVWRRFQEDVLRHEGPRAVSAEVEKLLRGTDLDGFAEALAEIFPRPGRGLPSLGEVERTRPRVRGRMAELIREARDERAERVLGLKRRRKALHRGSGH
ncbi:MAG TPA: hypothetical protein VF992_10380 [Thermoplasmata archaeon]